MTVRIVFRGGQTSNLRTEFSEREKYKRLISIPGQIDTLYESHYYGFLNHRFEPVYFLSEDSILNDIPDNPSSLRAINFVERAFSLFREDYLQRVADSTRSFPAGLRGINPVQSYQDFEEAYEAHQKSMIIHYANELEQSGMVSPNFLDFLDSVESLMEQTLEDIPVSRSGFLLSDRNTVYTTGLVLDLAGEDFDDDEVKGRMVQSEDFRCYCEYAHAAGFMVDKNIPWRLYIDLESEIIKTLIRHEAANYEISENHSSFNSHEVLDSIYRDNSQNDDLYDIQDFLMRTYNQLFLLDPLSASNNWRMSFFSDPVSEPQMLKMLLKIRLLEFGVLDQIDLDKTFKQVELAHELYGVEQACGKIGQICVEIFKMIIS